MAYGIGRRVGNAVTRNRVRRRLRAIVRDLDRAEPWPGGAYLVTTGPEAATLPYGELVDAVTEAAARLQAAR